VWPNCARPSRPRVETLYGATTTRPEITVTAGATQAIFTAVMAVVHPGDDVIVIEPMYDSYAQHRAGRGQPGVRADDGRASRSTGRASKRLSRRAPGRILVNTPHNPSGRILRDPTTCARSSHRCRRTTCS
jgi:methionine aminotransferase